MTPSRRPRGLALALVLLVAAAALPAAASADASERVRVLIEYVERPGRSDVAAVRRAGGTVDHRYAIVPALAARVPETAIERLRDDPRVTSVERDGRAQALDYRPTHDWGIAHVKADQVHAGGNTGTAGAGADVRVAVLDSGIDCVHLELDSNCTLGPTYVDGTTSSHDDNGHGTHVAGAVAAERNAGVSSGAVGVAPTADVIAYKVLDSEGYGNWSDIVAALDHVWQNGTADVVNMSLGGSSAPSTLEDAANRAYGAGVLLVAAAGNGGNCGGNNDSVSVPADYDSVVAVAAVDKDDTRPCWSATGPQVELSAPGVSTYSTWPHGKPTSSHDPQPVCEDLICHYKYGSGTSMASPHAAGAAALVIAAGITDANGAYGIADEVRKRLADTAVDLGTTGRDSRYGHGLIDALAATGGGGGNAAPTASFTYACVDLACDFDATASGDLDGAIASYAWDFGDGATGSGATVSHSYVSGGTYTVTLTVTDDAGATDTETQTVSVSDGATATLSITGISPNAIGPGTTSVTIGGSGFVSGTAVALEGGKGPTPSATVTGVASDGTSLTADVYVTPNGPSGSSQWDVRVTNPDGTSAVLVDGLTVSR